MEIEVADDSENKTVGRREIKFYVLGYESTPARPSVKTELCKKLNLNPDSTVVVRMDQAFGTKRSMGMAHIYPTAEAMKHYEQEHLFERGVRAQKKKEKKEAEAGGEKAASVEEKKEEKTEEKKE